MNESISMAIIYVVVVTQLIIFLSSKQWDLHKQEKPTAA